MVVIFDNDFFIASLQQMYAGTRKWGTVRLQINRSFTEEFKYKKSKQAERVKQNIEKSNDTGATFGLKVKAATPKLRLSTIVLPENAKEFEQKLTAVMSQSMFKGVSSKDKPAKKAKKTGKPTDARQVGKRETGRNQIKKNRKERRKE